MMFPLRTALLLALAAPFSATGCVGADDATEGDAVDGAEDELTASQLAGAYQHWSPNKANGEISQLHLRADKTFLMLLDGEFGCDVYAGYSCPASWSDGRTGSTYVSGTWKATTKSVVLQPAGEGRPSAPIPMTVTVTGTKAKVEGTIVPKRRIFGELDVIGLYGKPHTVKNADLVGTWRFTTKNDKDGFQPNLDGTNLFVGTEYEHVVTFRDTGSYLEDRLEIGKKSRRKKDDGTYAVAGAPDGKGGPGIVILDRGGLWDDVRIVKLAGTKLTFDVDPGASSRRIEAERQP